MQIDTVAQLREIYPEPKGRAIEKQLHCLEQHSLAFIALSPFVIISTANASGAQDCSPRGGHPGFIISPNTQELLIPDAKGNNRTDSLINIIENPFIACCFLIPGVDETLRVNGHAELTTDEDAMAFFANTERPPISVIRVRIEEVFLHCAKALMRSKLWSPDAIIERDALPTMGQMINDQIGSSDIPETQSEMVRRYSKDL